MCGNILFVLNEYVNMIVDSRLIGDNHLDRVEDFLEICTSKPKCTVHDFGKRYEDEKSHF